MDDSPPPIGKKIKRARERLRWSQQRLADEIGVTQKTIDNWEHDRSYPKSSIGALEDVLGVSLDGDGGQGRTIDPVLRRLVHEALDDEEDRRRVIGLLEGTLTWPGEAEAPEQPGEDGAQGQNPSAG